MMGLYVTKGVHQTAQTTWLHPNQPKSLAKWSNCTTLQMVMSHTASHCVVQSVILW